MFFCEANKENEKSGYFFVTFFFFFCSSSLEADSSDSTSRFFLRFLCLTGGEDGGEVTFDFPLEGDLAGEDLDFFSGEVCGASELEELPSSVSEGGGVVFRVCFLAGDFSFLLLPLLEEEGGDLEDGFGGDSSEEGDAGSSSGSSALVVLPGRGRRLLLGM